MQNSDLTSPRQSSPHLDAKAGRWLRKAKSRFGGRSPLEMLRTEAGARLVEEMLLQLDYGFVA